MRSTFSMLVVLAAVALSSAPAHATPLLSCDVPCETLLPEYWEDPSQHLCKSLLAISCGWY